LLAQPTTEIGGRNDGKGPLPYAIAARQLGAAEIEIKLDRIKLFVEMGTTSEKTLSGTLAKSRDEKFLRSKATLTL
jgi:hypothetical protein